MESTFKISALGIQPGHDPQMVRTQLQPMLKGDAATVQGIFHRISLNEQVVLGENIPQDKAQTLLEKLTAIGLKCRIDPMALSLVPVEEEQKEILYRCPACGHRQPPAAGGNVDICERCGVVGRNYEAANELKQALELERRRLKSTLEKEKREKLEAVKDKADKKKEKAQQELLDRARRQAERELGIYPWHKLKFLLKPDVLYPVLGSVTVALIGVGLLVWQLQQGRATSESEVANAKPAGLQLTVTQAPGAVFKVEGVNPPAASSDADNPAEVAAPRATDAASTTGKPQGEAVATASVKPPGEPAGTGATDATAPGQPAPLLNVDKLALAPPADGSVAGQAARSAARDPQLLAGLARYQMQTGDLAAAVRSIDRAIELLSAERSSLSISQLDAFNRVQVDVRAGIANQHHQRRELATAQTYWFRATNLANSITTPSERAQALSRLARTLNDTQASTAKDYFNRSIEATRLITEPFSQALVLGAIARDLAQTSRLEQSQTLFDQAAAAIKAMQNPDGRLVAQAILAKHRAEAGDTAAAKALLGQLAGELGGKAPPPELGQQQAEAFSAMALNLVNRGEIAIARADFAAALQQAQALTDPTLRAATLLYLARDIAAAGDRAAAAKLVAAAGTWD